MLHALLGAWLVVLAILASIAATTAYRMPDVQHPSNSARLAHVCLAAWTLAGFVAILGTLLWEAL